MTRSGHVLVLCELLLLLAVDAFPQVVDSKITEQQAKLFARAALPLSASSGILERMESVDPRFYMYAGESPEGSSGSPIFGYFAVNPHTGEVWDVEGSVCTLQVTKAVTKMQRELRKRFRFNQRKYRELQNLKPSVCDSN